MALMVVLISIDVIFKWSIASKKIVLRFFYDTTFTHASEIKRFMFDEMFMRNAL